MSWKTYRVINNVNYINKINKVIFLQRDNMNCEYNDEIELSFPKYKQDGSLDMNDGIVKVSVNTKIMIEINPINILILSLHRGMNSTYLKTTSRLTLTIVGMKDAVVNTNNLYNVSVCDVVNDDVIKIVLNKDTTEESTDFIDILRIVISFTKLSEVLIYIFD